MRTPPPTRTPWSSFPFPSAHFQPTNQPHATHSDEARVAAFAKRLLGAAALHGSAALAAGVVFLLSEVTKAQPSLRAALVDPAKAGEAGGYDATKREPCFAFAGAAAAGTAGAEAGEQAEVAAAAARGKPHLWELALLRCV